MQPSARRRRDPSARSAIAVLVIALAALPAQAETNGIARFSGMSGGSFCSNAGFGCHEADDISRKPTVRFDGPTQLDPGAVGTFRFVVVSGAPQTQIAAGLDVAASGGRLIVVAGQQAKLLDGEITHTGPKDNDENGEAAWEFQWQAPTRPGNHVLFGAGNSVDFFGNPGGDLAAITTLMVAVGDVPTPTVTAVPTATPPLVACAGDCDGNGAVAVNELIAGVNIALDLAAVDLCLACDTDDDSRVSINELIAAVSRALSGCGH